MTRTRTTGRKASGFFLLEQNQTANHRCALIIVGLIVLCATGLDETPPGKSADKRLTCPSYEPNEPAAKRGLICGRIDSFDRQLRPAKQVSTPQTTYLREDTDRLAVEAEAAPRLIDYANENQDGDDLKDAADDSQDTTDDSQDDADDCVE